MALSFIEPMLLKPCDALPAGEQWRYELKFDGFRGLAIKNGKDVRLFSRNANNLTARFPPIINAIAALPAKSAIIDGEIVCLDDAGRPCFEDLQNYQSAGAGLRKGHVNSNLHFYAFDLPALNGKPLATEPLETRKNRLRDLLADAPPQLRFSDFLDCDPTALVDFARENRLEGIVAKRADSPYEPGKRSGAWRKFKTYQQADFLIGGYLPGPEGIEALTVGFYRENEGGGAASLIYAARVEVYLKGRQLSALLAALAPLSSVASGEGGCPFLKVPRKKSGDTWNVGLTAEDHARMIWLKPSQTATIRFTEWTRSGLLRHAGLVWTKTG